jgi:hypothetical protein
LLLCRYVGGDSSQPHILPREYGTDGAGMIGSPAIWHAASSARSGLAEKLPIAAGQFPSASSAM